MERLLGEVKASAHAVTNSAAQEAFVIREAVKERHEQTATCSTVDKPISLSSIQVNVSFENHAQALRILQNEPDIDTLLSTLQWLISTKGQQLVDINLPGPTQAQLIHVIVESILPTYWHVLDGPGRSTLASCLSSIAGLKAAVLSGRRLLRQRNQPSTADRQILDVLELLDTITKSSDIFRKLWLGLCAALPDAVRFTLAWKETVNFFGSNVLAEIQNESTIKLGANACGQTDLRRSAAWHASAILSLASTTAQHDGADPIAAASQLFVISFKPGRIHTASILHIARHCVVESNYDILIAMLGAMKRSDKHRYAEVLLQCLSVNGGFYDIDETHVAGIASLLYTLMTRDEGFRQEIAKILLDGQAASKSSSMVRQAALIALAKLSAIDLSSLLTKAIATFGDQLFINQGLMLQQEAIAHIVLVSTGLLYRRQPTLCSTAVRSGCFLQAISSRLATSSTRARWLGMIVSTAISRLIDKHGAQVDFGTTDMDTAEAQRWLRLTHTLDSVGCSEDIILAIDSVLKPQGIARHRKRTEVSSALPIIGGKQSFGPPRPPQLLQTEVEGDKVTELIDDSSEADDGFKPYAKPDSDPEDSDEDATLVNRNKAKPPVYVRTLLAMLQDTEKADSFQLALRHAAPLIRRKTGFGKEISDHAEELARLLCSLQDPFDTEDFDNLRLQALIALVLSDVTVVAPWLSRQAFARDYSIAQRSIILTAVGLSGRELAGYKHEDELNRTFDNASFPSKQLPGNMKAFYDSDSKPRLLDIAAQHVERSMIQPMALAAADHSTSHLDAVKVRKFSSRMEVERTKKKPAANKLAKNFKTAFFEPLVINFHQEMAVLGDVGTYFSTPMLLATFLKTLAILLHAAGPATLGLAHITSDLWETLLHLRIRATTDIMIMEAVLFCFLTLLEVNDNPQTLAQNNPKQLMETKEWAEVVFERTGGGTLIEGEGEEARIRTLCAGVLTKASGIISAYQKMLIGNWSNV